MPSLQHSITSLQHSRLHEPHLNVSAAHQLYFLCLYKSISRYLFLYMYAWILLAYLNVKVWPVYVDKCILFWSKVNFDWHAIFSLKKVTIACPNFWRTKKEKWSSDMCYIIFLFMSLYCSKKWHKNATFITNLPKCTRSQKWHKRATFRLLDKV